MKRCNHCQQYAAGQPTFCPQCGRSYDVRICARGHVNVRQAQFCTTCGNADFSTPAPPESPLVRLSRLSLWLATAAALMGVSVAIGMALLHSLSSDAVIGPLVLLILWLAFFQWAVSLIPPPIRKLGRSAGRQVVKAWKGHRERH